MRELPSYNDDEFWADPRRRATVILVILAVTAALVVSFMVYFVGTSGGHPVSGLVDVGTTAQRTQPTQASPRVTRKPTAIRTSHPQSTSALPAPTSTANPCPSATPCTVAGDRGGAVAALNKFRASHGLPTARGAATAQAQQCALGQGDGPACQTHYAWQPVATQDGSQVISKIVEHDGGRWLLDPAASSFSVGWAYTPGANGGPGQYGCAILKVA